MTIIHEIYGKGKCSPVEFMNTSSRFVFVVFDKQPPCNKEGNKELTVGKTACRRT